MLRKFPVIFFSFIYLFVLSPIHAQQVSRCSTMEYLQVLEQEHPGALQRWLNAQHDAREWIQEHPGDTRTVYNIPVVVHVVWRTVAENISDEQIQSQIDVLNEDFNRLNADTSNTPAVWKPVAGSIPVQFCLAAFDPNGDTTTGIDRVQTNVLAFDLSDNIKHVQLGGADGWPDSNYFNIWTGNLGNNTLGYATLPGLASDNEDGVVCLYKAFGRTGTVNPPYNKGRVTTHEAGHWLGLTHIWGDDGGNCTGTDGCTDTPNQTDATYGCPTFPVIDPCSSGSGIMFMNYMDFTDDSCMNLFTVCQDTMMEGILETVRAELQFSPAGCQGNVGVNEIKAEEISFQINNPVTDLLSVSILGNRYSMNFEVNDLLGRNCVVIPVTQKNFTIDCSTLPRGIYICELKDENVILEAKKLVIERN